MGPNARIGFHAVYTDSNGQSMVSSAGNALVGAYLNQLGLPSPAIYYITNTSPNEIQWLTFSDAQNYGVDVQPFNLALATVRENLARPSLLMDKPTEHHHRWM
jgi:hypothetical protein